MENITHFTQNGFIKGRSIIRNLQLQDDVNFLIHHNYPDGVIGYLDFRKAFDSIHHEHLLEVLKNFGFPPTFLTWILKVLQGRTARLLVNGHLHKNIRLQRGVFQGDPLSPLLYVIAIEPLAMKLRTMAPTHGIKCINQDIISSTYADDHVVFASSQPNMTDIITVINNFGPISGNLLNHGKCDLHVMNHHHIHQPLINTGTKIKNIGQETTSLGITMALSNTCMERSTLAISKMITKMNLWKKVPTTQLQKALLVQLRHQQLPLVHHATPDCQRRESNRNLQAHLQLSLKKESHCLQWQNSTRSWQIQTGSHLPPLPRWRLGYSRSNGNLDPISWHINYEYCQRCDQSHLDMRPICTNPAS